MGLVDIKTFRNLEDDVISVNRCCACGACIAYCENQVFNVIEMENYIPKFKTDKSVENCKECGYCYYICPQTEPLLDKLKMECCGNPLDKSDKEISLQMIDNKFKSIQEAGANCITLVCPACFQQFDFNQRELSKEKENSYNFPVFIYQS